MLRDVLIDRIQEGGPMPFEAFMAACLYDAGHGFFTTGPVRSTKDGDFLTSPEVSPWFGRTVARYVAHRHREISADAPMLVEVGAGSGSLLRNLLAHLDVLDAVPSVCWAVDASPQARDALAAVDGVDAVATAFDEVPAPIAGIIVANELLDNLPVALAVRSGEGWEERWVGAEADQLVLVAAPVRPDVAVWCGHHAGVVPEGGMVEVQLAATDWVRNAVSRLERGSVVIFDYGGTKEELEPRRTLGTLRTYRRHHLGPDPLTAPGATDVTVDVNFSAMETAATEAGARVTVWRQDDFLAEWGLRSVLSDLRHKELELAGGGPEATMERLMVRSELTDAETLLHPRGLGDFRVLVAEVS